MTLKSWLVAIVFGVGLITSSLFGHAAESDDSLSQAISKLALNWSEIESVTNLNHDVISSWLPERGIRGRYQIAKKN